MIRMRAHLIATLCLAALPALALAAPVPSDTDKAKGESPAEKTRKALDKSTDLEIADMALPAAVTKLREDTKLNFVLDYNTLVNFVGDPNSFVVSVKQKNTKLKTSLRLMLNQYHLSYAIVGDAIIITTEDMAMQRQMKQRVSVELDAVPFSDAVRQLARETATNVLVDAKVKKEADLAVTLQLEDVPLETAIRLLSEMVGLKPVRLGNVLYVTSKANANELRSDPDLISGQPGGPPVQPPPIIGPGGLPPGIGLPGQPAPPPPVIVPEVPAPPKEKDEKGKEDKGKEEKPSEEKKPPKEQETPVFAPINEGTKGSSETPVEKVRKSLQQTVTIEIVEQPLEQAITRLKEETKLNLVLDHAAVAPAFDPNLGQFFPPGGGFPPGVGPGGQPQTVTLKVKDMKVRDALRTMLSSHNLTYVIIGDSVLVTTEHMAMQRQLKQRVSVDLDAVPFTQAIKQLARETGANLLVDTKLKKEIETAVTLQVDDVPLDTAVRLIAEAAGLKPVRLGNVLYLTTKANAAELRADPDLFPPANPQQQLFQDEIILRGGGIWRGIGGWGGIVPGITPVPTLPPPPAPDPTEKDKQPDKPKVNPKETGDKDK